MIQLLFYINGDFYAKPPKPQLQFHRTFLDDGDYRRYVNDYRNAFQAKQFQSLHLVAIQMQPESGVFEVLLNEFGEHPLKTLKELNPKAAEVQKKKPKSVWAEMLPPGVLAADNFDEAALQNVPDEPEQDEDD